MKIPKTKKEIAHSLGISMSTLKRHLKKNDLHIPRGLISPEQVELIYRTLGYPLMADRINQIRRDRKPKE